MLASSCRRWLSTSARSLAQAKPTLSALIPAKPMWSIADTLPQQTTAMTASDSSRRAAADPDAVTVADVERLADAAKISLPSAKDVEALQRDLALLTHFAGQVRRHAADAAAATVDTSSPSTGDARVQALETASSTRWSLRTRDDTPNHVNQSAALLSRAAKTHGPFFAIPNLQQTPEP
ncbi:hypothetical protein CAOG_00341 [Capsaspora owczarzaki ATCC 30864]|uniref:Glutamyl-tRNA(Gln) amidotransferase subunit C, mitochondrial n=1 Tax=Capsaspora owczarzaki (strain ATCC 30864) TaxID=595528 RepID=A0A0D2WID6_CAPO3|nr:hypothetical protein CAOG_00341 [Capsaspora owczarzaki ATCC 30864]KJE88748.1 hypothetical protein CAOG_000341 [Capsaspora owczarzaki ATCC 30864]|eukprot:XP_004365212.1 hypothetical protein CAOG_00341 [Capsaspora owczarzaki ATCC 30864]